MDHPVVPNASSEALELLALGPVVVSFRGQPINLGGTKSRALIARLLVDRGIAIPVDAILESVWPEGGKNASETTLRSTVSRLRQRIRAAGVEAEVIATCAPGYALEIDPDRTDIIRFERLFAQGRAHLASAQPGATSTTIGQALSLWRGPAFSEVRDEPFAQGEARRLDELRLSATEIRIEADLQLGHHREVLAELEALTAANWTRERLWRHRMLALYRSGLGDEALLVADQLRTTLVERLGIEPGPEVIWMEQAIRDRLPELDLGAEHKTERVRPALSTPAPGDRVPVLPLPAPCAKTPNDGLVGRAAERELLSSLLHSVAAEGRHRLVFLGGEPGIGKSTLAAHVAQLAHQEGAIVLFGQADEEVGTPYQPWAEVLTHLVEHAPDSLRRALHPFAAPLVRMTPSLGRFLDLPEDSETAEPEAARYVWFGAVLSALQVAAAIAPVVLVLEDLQWADTPSLRLLRHVASSAEPSPILIIGTFRESTVGLHHPLAPLLGDARRMGNADRIDLGGLTREELRVLMEITAGQALDDVGLRLRDALLAETGGNPFFVGELLQHSVDTGAIYQREGRWFISNEIHRHGLPSSVREVIGQRVTRLGEVAIRVLSVASVIGRDFDFRLLAASCEVNEGELLDVLDIATEAALIVNPEGDRYRFIHALVEHTLYEALTPERRAQLHRSVARAIERQTHVRFDQRVVELAHHWSRTHDPSDLSKAIGYARTAGELAMGQLAPDEALRWYARALTLLERQPDDRLRCQLLIGTGTAQRLVGDATFRATLMDAAALAQDIGSTELLVAAALANSRGYFSAGGAVDAERVTVLEKACSAIAGTESADEACLLALLATELTFDVDLDRRRNLLERALQIARQCDPSALAFVGHCYLTTLNLPGTLAERMSISSEALFAAQQADDAVSMFWCAYWRANVLYQAGDVKGADACAAMSREIADRLGQPTLLWADTYARAARAMLAGDCDEGERLALLAAEIGSTTGQPDAYATFTIQLGCLHRMRGTGDQLVDLMRQAAIDNPGIPGFASGVAAFCIDLDRYDEAQEAIEPFVADGLERLRADLMWLFTVTQRAYVVAKLGWVEPAESLFTVLLPFADQYPYATATTLCQVNHYLGLLAASLGRPGEAELYFERAAHDHERIGAQWCLAMTRLEWADFLLQRADPERVPQVRTLLTAALHAADAGGYQIIRRRARHALETLPA